MHDPADLIGGQWKPIPGDAVRSHNPASPAETVWQGSPRLQHIDDAVRAARAAAPVWARTPIEKRIEAIQAFKKLCEESMSTIAALLSMETGKAMWEAEAEAKLLSAKVDNTLFDGPMSAGSGRARITGFEIPITASRQGRCAFRPHGVMAVLGPFNFPVHLPNGHIVPALLTGNTIIFKPSDKTPAVGQLLASLYQRAIDSIGAPPGVFNLVQGGADIASRLVTHDGIDGILFTGSWPVGRRILEANLDRPGRIIALELGGSNPAVVMPDADLRLAAVECVRAAFATTGQRCTCTRRLIVHEAIAAKFIPLISKIASNLLIGGAGFGGTGFQPVSPQAPSPKPQAIQQPFMGPLIRGEAVAAALRAQQRWQEQGGVVILESTAMDSPMHGHYITPGIMRVDRFTRDEAGCGGDIEIFGPLLRFCTVRSLDEAIDQSNATRYGLAASIFTADRAAHERFLTEVRAGCININTGTAGASGKLPFGGLGISGNHRPAGSFALDYTTFPVASMIESSAEATLSPGMRLDEGWLAA